ncbi:hypothetical protein IKQ21_07940 [bacterium]|nr:hypothetical protein [bacterium]
MRVYGITSTSFNGKFLPTPALEKYQAGLNDAQKAIYSTQKTLIESVNDGKEYVYDVFGMSPICATIYEKNKSGTKELLIPIFSDYERYSADLFDSLYKKYQLEIKHGSKRV